MKAEDLDCPYDFTSRCTMGRCDCKPKTRDMSLYEKLRKRYHSKSGMYLNKKTCADLEEFIEEIVAEENSKPIWKLNGGNPITLCKFCFTTIAQGTVDERHCDECKAMIKARAANYMNLNKK